MFSNSNLSQQAHHGWNYAKARQDLLKQDLLKFLAQVNQTKVTVSKN